MGINCCDNRSVKEIEDIQNKDNINNNSSLNYIQENYINFHPNSITKFQISSILNQMEKSVCKIKCKEGGHGTGFFCIIPFPDRNNQISVLITNNHVLGEKELKIGNVIIFTLNDDEQTYSIYIDKNRKIYTNHVPYDITIVEIKYNDNLNINELEIIDEIYNNESIKKYEEKPVYIIHYPDTTKIEYSFGYIKGIIEESCNIKHLCPSKSGSSGSPLLNLSNFKVMGVHKGKQEVCNISTYIKGPIEEFNKIFNNSKNVIKVDI